MSIAGLKFFRKPNFIFSFIPKGPTQKYLKIWKKEGVSFEEKLGSAGENMANFPNLVDRIIQIESVMKDRNLIPFIHAMPAGSQVLMHFYQSVNKEKGQFFKHLRKPGGFYSIPFEEARKAIPIKKVEAKKPHLISMSYALTSGIQPLETAASWGFINHFGNEQNFSLLKEWEEAIDGEYPYFREKGWRLIREYGRLKVGNFLIIGVPEHLISRYVYDSKPYNVPTGKEVLSVANEPEKHLDTLLPEGAHLASLIICKETLDPKSGIVMIRANDKREVQDFCKGEISQNLGSCVEENETKTRENLDRQVQELVDEFFRAKSGGFIPPKELEEEDSLQTMGDFPSLAI